MGAQNRRARRDSFIPPPATEVVNPQGRNRVRSVAPVEVYPTTEKPEAVREVVSEPMTPQRTFPDLNNVNTYQIKSEESEEADFTPKSNPPEIPSTTQSRSAIPLPKDVTFYEDLTEEQRARMFKRGMNFDPIGMPRRDFNPDELIPESRNKPNYLGDKLPANYAGHRSDIENPQDIMIHRANLSGRGPTWNTTVARPDERGRYIEGAVGTSELAKRNYAIASDPRRSAVERARAAADYLGTSPDQSAVDLLKDNQNNIASFEEQTARNQAITAREQASLEAAQKAAIEQATMQGYQKFNETRIENGFEAVPLSEYKEMIGQSEEEQEEPEQVSAKEMQNRRAALSEYISLEGRSDEEVNAAWKKYKRVLEK